MSCVGGGGLVLLRWLFLVRYAHIAQLVEHVLGKNEVTSSNLVVGFSPKEVI